MSKAKKKVKYKPSQAVQIRRWVADKGHNRWIPATIVQQVDNDNYEVCDQWGMYLLLDKKDIRPYKTGKSPNSYRGGATPKYDKPVKFTKTFYCDESQEGSIRAECIAMSKRYQSDWAAKKLIEKLKELPQNQPETPYLPNITD